MRGREHGRGYSSDQGQRDQDNSNASISGDSRDMNPSRPDQGRQSIQIMAHTPAIGSTSATAASASASAHASASASISAPPHSELRPPIYIVNSNLQPSDPISRRIIIIFKEKLITDGYCWKTVSEEISYSIPKDELKKHLSRVLEDLSDITTTKAKPLEKGECSRTKFNRTRESEDSDDEDMLSDTIFQDKIQGQNLQGLVTGASSAHLLEWSEITLSVTGS